MAATTVPSLEEIDKIGEAAEQEYEAELPALDDSTNATPSNPNAKPKRIRLSTGQRMRLVEDFRKGKLDKYYSVTIDKKRPGEFRITKRRKPLNTPEIEVTAAPDNIAVPPATTIQGEITEPTAVKQTLPTNRAKQEKPDKVNIEFYAMQNNINNSLSREIQAVMEKCNKIEQKMKEQRAEAKSKRKSQPEPEEEYEYEYSDGEPPTPDTPVLDEGVLRQSPAQPPQPQYRMFNARSRINLLRDFR